MAGIKDLITQIPPEYRLYLQTMFPGQKTGAIDEGYFSQDFKDQLKDQVLSKIEMGLGFDSPPAYDESMRFMFPSGTVTKGTILPADYRTAANPAGTTDPKYYKGERGSSPTGYSSAFNTLGTYQYEYKMPTAPAFDNAAIVVTDKYDWNPMYGTVPEQNFTGYIGEGFGDVKGSDVDEKMLFEFVKNQIKDKKLDTASALELIGNYLGPKESKGEGRDIRIEIPVDTPTATTDDAKREIREVDTRRGAVRGAQQDISNYQDFGEVPLAKGGRVGYALGSPEPLNVSNEEKRIAFDIYQALKDIEEQYTGETIAGDPSPQNLDPSDRRQGTLMAGGDFPEFENYADVIDAYNSGVAVEPGESLTDYIKRNNIKIKEIEMDPLDDLEKTFKGAAGGRVNYENGDIVNPPASMMVDTTTFNPIPEDAARQKINTLAKYIAQASVGDDEEMSKGKEAIKFIQPLLKNVEENFGTSREDVMKMLREELLTFMKPKKATGGRVKLGSGAGVIDYGKKYLKYKDRPTQERLNKIIEDLREGGAMSADAALDLALKQIREE